MAITRIRFALEAAYYCQIGRNKLELVETR
jgi:hypothetical protein